MAGPGYQKTLNNFVESIINENASVAVQDLKKNARIKREDQMKVYIEGYYIRLENAVKADYPATEYLLGKKFERLVSDYVKKNNSEFYNLDAYPIPFADFIKTKDIRNFPKELAKLESEIIKVFMAPDSKEFGTSVLAGKTEDEIGVTDFRLRDAHSLLEFECDVENFLREFRAGKKPKEGKTRKLNEMKNYFMLVRHDNEVKRHRLDDTEYEVLRNLEKGLSLEGSISAAINSDIETEKKLEMYFQNWFIKWLQNGFFRSQDQIG